MNKCPYCDYTSKKCNILIHLQRKEKCNNNIPIEKYISFYEELKNRPRISVKSNKSENGNYLILNPLKNCCDYCKKEFSTKYTLNNHLAKCPKKQQNEIFEQQKLLINQYQKLLETIDEKNNSIINNIDNSINNIDNSTKITNNVINNQTYIVNYGKEDFSYITDEIKLGLIKDHCLMSWKYLLDLKHFNNEKPEFQNINLKRKDSKTKFINIFKDGKWVWYLRKDILDELRRDLLNDLEEVSDDTQPIGMSDHAFEKFRKFLEKHNTNDDNPEFNSKIEVYLYEKDEN